MHPTKITPNTAPVKDAAASSTVPTRPIIIESVIPISIWLTCPTMIGKARASVCRSSCIHLIMTKTPADGR